MADSTVLITGGAGFIGSHLSEALIAQGKQVVALDNLSTGNSRNLDDLIKSPDFKLVRGSVLDTNLLGPLVEEADVVFHLAAAVGVQYVVENLVDTLETNIEGTRNVLSLAERHGGKKVLLASSSEVFGKNTSVTYSEDDDMAIGPSSIGRWGYACSKMLDEFLAMAYHKERGLPVVVFRLFNTVGPRQTGRYGMAVPRFVANALSNEPIKVHGDGNQTRCFAHVADVVRALTVLADASEAVGQVFNLGNDTEISIGELATLVKSMLGSDSPIVYIPYADAYGSDFEDIRRRVPNISKIRGLINYQPVNDLSKIIRDVAEDMKRESVAEKETTGTNH